MMFGTMMDYPLTLPHILERAGKLSGRVEIVSRLPDKSLHRYTYADFYRDWGPGGEWGLVKSHRIYGSANTKGLMSGGAIVEVIVNERAEHARMFVQKSDKTITVYPY